MMTMFCSNNLEFTVTHFDRTLYSNVISIEKDVHTISELQGLLDTSSGEYEVSILDESMSGCTFSSKQYFLESVSDGGDCYVITYVLHYDIRATETDRVAARLEYLAMMVDVDLEDV